MSREEEAIVVAFRRHTPRPLDDGLYALHATLPCLTRASWHRCLQRHGMSRLPEAAQGDTPTRKNFKSYPSASFHIDIAEVQPADGRRYLLVAIDRTRKFAFVPLHPHTGKLQATPFPRDLQPALP